MGTGTRNRSWLDCVAVGIAVAVSVAVVLLYLFVDSMTQTITLPPLASKLMLLATAVGTLFTMLAAYASAMTPSRRLWVGVTLIALAALSLAAAIYKWWSVPVVGLAVGYAAFLAWLTAYGFWKAIPSSQSEGGDQSCGPLAASSFQASSSTDSDQVEPPSPACALATDSDHRTTKAPVGIGPSHLLVALLLGLILGILHRPNRQ